MPRIGVVSDIAKAFLQMALNEDQRDVTRFFWLKNTDVKPIDHPDNIMVYRFTRVLFGAKASPSMLNLTLDHHLSQYESPIARLIRSNIYVDNVIVGVDTTEEGYDLYEQAKKLFQEAKMELRQWNSNSKELMDMIEPNDRASETLSNKVLGLLWDLKTDELSSGCQKIKGNASTLREVIESVASVFDPLGMASPLFLAAKLFIQKLWKKNYSWDDTLSEELRTEYKALVHDLQMISTLKYPRFLDRPVGQLFQYHLICFTDGSTVAYAANVYLVIRNVSTSETTTHLLMSKLRLAPTKGLTIPTNNGANGSPYRDATVTFYGTRTTTSNRQETSVKRFTVCSLLVNLKEKVTHIR